MTRTELHPNCDIGLVALCTQLAQEKQAITTPLPMQVPVDEIVAAHTSVRPSRKLRMAFVTQSIRTGLPLLLVDMVFSAVGLLLAAFLVENVFDHRVYASVFKQLPAALLLQALLLTMHQLYPAAGASQVFELKGLVRGTWLTYTILSSLNALLGQLYQFEFIAFILAASFSSILLPLARSSARRVLSQFQWWGLLSLVVGEQDVSRKTCAHLQANPAWGYRPVGYAGHVNEPWDTQVEDDWSLGESVDATTIAVSFNSPALILPPGELCGNQLHRLVFQFPSIMSFGGGPASLFARSSCSTSDSGTTRICLPLLRFSPRIVKRAVDLAVAIPLLLLFAIPFAVIALLIKRRSSGPAFYGHTRIGQHGHLFKAWKFRTMVADGDQVLKSYLAENPAAEAEWERDQKLRYDPRVISGVGSFLRKWSLDELPQLWNVLVGQMSLVGPRPIVHSEIAKYAEAYFCYSSMLPGITGLWQISGRNNTTYETRVSLDEHYARNWSPWLDLWILIKTPAVVVNRDGAF